MIEQILKEPVGSLGLRESLRMPRASRNLEEDGELGIQFIMPGRGRGGGGRSSNSGS